MKTAHKIRMNPTAEQVEYLKRACGTRRFIYNWGREQWEKQYQAYKREQETVPEAERTLKPPTALALKKQFHAIREQQYPWTYDITKCVVEGAFSDLGQAYANFFAGRSNYPTFKKKGKSHESFYLSNDRLTLGSHWIAIPGFVSSQEAAEAQTGDLQPGQDSGGDCLMRSRALVWKLPGRDQESTSSTASSCGWGGCGLKAGCRGF